jgi:hypothetical protein
MQGHAPGRIQPATHPLPISDAASLDPDLARIISVWPKVPKTQRSGIAAMAEAAANGR